MNGQGKDGLIVGGHVSLGRNPAATVAELAEEGLDSMQIFASSPGQWRPPPLERATALQFREARQEHGVSPLVIHAIYLINLASDNPEFLRRSHASLVGTLRAGAQMGAATVVTHIGSHGGRGFESVAAQISERLLAVLAEAPPEIDLALENSAGAGGIVGSSLDELAQLLDLTGRPDRLKIALDTAHLCGAGWDLAAEGIAERLVAEVRAKIGLERLVVMHANDSAAECGSRKDRHANIGEGHVGIDGFRRLLAQEELRGLPWILETPNVEGRSAEAVTLRSLAREEVTGAA